MTYSISHNPDLDVIEMRVQGELDRAAARDLVANVLQLAREKNCFLILSDYREANMALSTSELYAIPELIAESARALGLQAANFRRALVIAGNVRDFLFFETVSQNRNQTVKLFGDYADAMSWLLSESAA